MRRRPQYDTDGRSHALALRWMSDPCPRRCFAALQHPEGKEAMTDKVIMGTGSYLPERIVTNDDIEQAAVDFDRERAGCTLDEWCRKQMGAVQRRRVAPGEGTSDMATRAAERALED